MVKLDIITGFLGAGKTTLINKLLAEGLASDNPVLIENEFGDVAIDKDLISSDIEVKLLSSGCICCSMKGDFIKGITTVIEKYSPNRIIIEPTGLADLGDVIAACQEAGQTVPLEINSVITVISTENFQPLMMVGGEFFRKQVTQARFAIMSCVQLHTPEEVDEVVAEFRKYNPDCPMLVEDWSKLDALYIMACAEEAHAAFTGEIVPTEKEHGHTADSFTSMPVFPMRRYNEQGLDKLIAAFSDEKYGQIFRAKGFLKMEDGSFNLVEYVYGKGTQRPCSHDGFTKFIVIGRDLNEAEINKLFMEV